MKKLLLSVMTLLAVAVSPALAHAASKTPAARLDLRPSQPAPEGFALRFGTVLPANPRMSLKPTAATVRPPKLAAESDPLLIYGSWTAHSESDVSGIYSFPAVANTMVTSVKIDTNLNANCGGCYHDGKYYMVYRIPEFGMVFYYVWDTTTWTRTYYTWGETFTQDYDLTYSCIASDMAFDPVSEKIYGTFCDDTGATVVFSAMDPDTGHSTPIKVESVGLNAIVATPKGDIMGIGMDGVLYSIDKFTGDYTRIGDTGLRPYYLSSATYDAPSQKIYYVCAPETDVAKLYEVDPATGAAALVTTIPDDPQVQGLYTTSPTVVDNAPGQCSAFNVGTDGPSLTVNASFRLPASNYAGDSALEGDISYNLYLDGRSVATGSDAPGATVDVDVTVPDDGQYTFSVIASNDYGSGPTSRKTMWVGYDAPRELTTVTLTKTGDNTVNLTWYAPYSGLHGGYLDKDNITYEIIRYPDAKIVAKTLKSTTFTESVAVPDGFQAYYYTVQARVGRYTNTPKASNTVNLGSAAYVPLVYTFDDGSNEADLFTVVKDNDNYSTWKYDRSTQSMYIDSSTRGDKNDWLVSPPVKLLGLTDYTLSFDASNTWQINGKPENMEVRLCTAADLESLQAGRVLVEEYEINTALQDLSPCYGTKTATFDVDNDGIYYIAFHATSPANMWKLYVDNIVLRSNLSPGAPTGLKVVPDADASLRSTFSFTAPTDNIGGSPLSRINRVEVFLNNVLANALYNVEPGTEKEMPIILAHGMNTLRVVAYNDEGAGLAAETRFFAGVDIPAAPEPVIAAINPEATSATVTWTPPAIGANGGYINPEAVFYNIYNSSNLSTPINQSQVWTEPACAITPTFSSRQAIGCYVIKAHNSEGEGPGAVSNIVFFGQAWPLTFRESFAGVSMQSGPWGYELLQPALASRNPEWNVGKDGDLGYWGPKAKDGDNGFAYYDPNGTEGSARLYSAKIDLTQAAAPTLDFWCVGEGNILAVEVSTDACATWQEVWRTDLTAEPLKEWTHTQVDLSAAKGHADVHIAFTGIYNQQKYEEIGIDVIRLRDLCDVDLSPVAVTAPTVVRPDRDFTVSVTVGNDGVKDAKDFTVELYRNGTKVTETVVDATLEPDSVTTVHFGELLSVLDIPSVEYKAVVVSDADGFMPNNTSSVVTVAVDEPIYPAATGLRGEIDENNRVNLAWTAPVLELKEPEAITESFEGSDFADFSATGGGGWTVYDGDDYATYSPKDGGVTCNAYPGQGGKNSFLVFNPAAIAITADAWQAHSGERMMTSFDAVYDNYPAKQTDDWLISPEVHPVAQTVSFYARSYYNTETMSFYVSSTDTNIGSFTQVGADKQVGTAWTRYDFEIPEGTKYFAIRNSSTDCLALSIDDVTYIPAVALPADLAILGYNVYRNGTRLNATPVDATSYVDTTTPDGENAYCVSVVYNYGESMLTAPLTLVYSGLDDIGLDGASVTAHKGFISVAGADGRRVTVTAPDGRVIYSANPAALVRIPASPGVYMVTVGTSATVKVAVR